MEYLRLLYGARHLNHSETPYPNANSQWHPTLTTVPISQIFNHEDPLLQYGFFLRLARRHHQNLGGTDRARRELLINIKDAKGCT